MTIIAITGHRPNKLNDEYNYDGPCSLFIKQQLKKLLILIKPEKVITGMALGVDTLFALVALDLNIPIIAAIPFEGQEKKWATASQKLYHEILNNPLTTKKVVSEGNYAVSKMYSRNEYMVDQCDTLIAVYDGTLGGTHQCIRYAQTTTKTIILINPKDYLKEETILQPNLF